MDTQYHVTDKLKDTQAVLTNYFEQALNNPTGRKLRDFYAKGAKQVIDIHNEAKRLADLKKQQQQQPEKGGVFQQDGKSTCTCGGNEGVCTCPPGKCACAGCAREGPKPYAQVGTAEGGSANRQSGAVKEDVVGTVKDIVQ